MELASFKKLTLKKHPMMNEQWLQDRIADDPSLLGLVDLTLIKTEKTVPGGGRIDMVLADDDSGRRYEVELMLGPTDPSHIVRVIEYWDIERRRYPGNDHVAVLVAEEITARFLNVLGLMAGSVPLIALQLNALEVGGKVVLDFVRILDQTEMRLAEDEDDGGGGEMDRAYWDKKIQKPLLKICDAVLNDLNAVDKGHFEHKYQRGYIGLRWNGVVNNIIHFTPKKTKDYVHFHFRHPHGADQAEKLKEAGLNASSKSPRRFRLTVTPEDFQKYREAIRTVISETVEHHV